MTYLIFVLAALTGFLSNSHVLEFSPVFGALLYTGARLKKRDAVWFPVSVLAFCNWILTARVFRAEIRWEYLITLLGFAAMAWTGGLLRRNLTPARFAACAIAGPTAYFLISNFGVWLDGVLYPQSWSGLAACYVAAIPYYRSSLISTFLVGGLLFASNELISRRMHGKRFESATAPVS